MPRSLRERAGLAVEVSLCRYDGIWKTRTRLPWDQRRNDPALGSVVSVLVFEIRIYHLFCSEGFWESVANLRWPVILLIRFLLRLRWSTLAAIR